MAVARKVDLIVGVVLLLQSLGNALQVTGAQLSPASGKILSCLINCHVKSH